MSRTEQHTFLVQAQTHTELVEEALSLIAAMYASRYPAHSTFSVLTGAHQNTANKTPTVYVTRAIVYTEETYSDWAVVEIPGCAFDSPIASLENFVKLLRGEFGVVACGFVHVCCSLGNADGLVARVEQRAVGDGRGALGMAPL